MREVKIDDKEFEKLLPKWIQLLRKLRKELGLEVRLKK